MNHNKLAQEIHAQNVKAGWWTDIQTKESITPIVTIKGLITHKRNIGEIFALIHSELSEAYEGLKFDKLDSHLPELHNFPVELGDTAIRLYDVAGAYGIYIPLDIVPIDFEESALLEDMSLMATNAFVSRAFEGFRKSNFDKAKRYVALSIIHIWKLAKFYNWDLAHHIGKKRKYNDNRADHKIENRLKPDGKKC